MFLYVLYFILLVGGIQIYFVIAEKYDVVDKPNHRSSHTDTIIRGGGIIFYLGALLWFFRSGFEYPWFYLGLTLISIISLLDDIFSLSNWIRLIAHLIAILLVFHELNLYSATIPYIVISVVVSIGIINFYNFMDGINGITGLYSLATISCFWYINNYLINFIQNDFIYLVGLALLVFVFYNTRVRAKCFSGDVGAISIVFILLFLLWKLVNQSGNISFFILLSVYGIDSVLTIIHRLILGENIFVAHRKHLYQILANECQMSHVIVAAIYSLIQVIIFIGYVFLYNASYKIHLIYFITVAICLSIIYFFLKKKFYRLHLDNVN
tara:strand:- start:12875 stop:13846 length:972 start_codon:yes stop_codon:yes gene_type:complete